MKNERVYFEQILDATRKIRSFIKGFDRDSFEQDEKTQSAIILQLMIIGELAKKLSSESKSTVPLPWKEIAGFRDRAIHDYFSIDLSIIWESALHDIVEVEMAVEEYLQRPS